MENCKKCSDAINGNFCSNCGARTYIQRIDKSHIIHEFEHYVLHYEKGILFTLKELTFNPGNAIRNFINGDREHFYKPIAFLIITSGLYTLLDHYIGYHPSEAAKILENSAKSFMREHVIYFSLLQILITSTVMKYIFYRKEIYNIYEYFIVLSYSSGMTISFSTIGILVSKLTHWESAQYLVSFIGLFYGIWLLGQFMASVNYKGYIKAAGAKILSLIIFFILSSIVFTTLTILNIKY